MGVFIWRPIGSHQRGSPETIVHTKLSGWCLSVVLVGCAHRGDGPNPALTEPTLDASDWRQAFRGTWEVTFRLDSTRSPGGGWVKATGAEAVGRLVVTDSLAGSHGRSDGP